METHKLYYCNSIEGGFQVYEKDGSEWKPQCFNKLYEEIHDTFQISPNSVLSFKLLHFIFYGWDSSHTTLTLWKEAFKMLPNKSNTIYRNSNFHYPIILHSLHKMDKWRMTKFVPGGLCFFILLFGGLGSVSLRWGVGCPWSFLSLAGVPLSPCFSFYVHFVKAFPKSKAYWG